MVSGPRSRTRQAFRVMKELLASAPTLELLQESITAFYAGCPKILVPEDTLIWSVWAPRETGNIRLYGVRVRKLNNRYRFEMMGK